jgi:hypothetical protein
MLSNARRIMGRGRKRLLSYGFLAGILAIPGGNFTPAEGGERPMIYHFDLAQNGDTARDDEGTDFLDLETLREEAHRAAREIMANAVSAGHTARDFEFQIRDESGARVLTFPFTMRLRYG